jgi:hypothetical protein
MDQPSALGSVISKPLKMADGAPIAAGLSPKPGPPTLIRMQATVC